MVKKKEEMKKFVTEFGMGIDLHGQDVTKAAARAVKEAISWSSLTGLVDLVGLSGKGEAKRDYLIDVTIASPYPDEVNAEEVLKVLPVGRRQLTSIKGGLKRESLYIEGLDKPEAPEYIIAIACVEVYVDI